LVAFSIAYPTLAGSATLDGLHVTVAQNTDNGYPQCGVAGLVGTGIVLVVDASANTIAASCEQAKAFGTTAVRQLRAWHLVTT